MINPSLKMQTLRGVIFNFFIQFLRGGINGLTALALAWFLVPGDFALVGMIAMALALANVMAAGGLRESLIRKVDVSSAELNAVFLANIGLAVFTYSLLFAAAPFIATFFAEPRLESLLRVAGLSVLFTALTIVPQVVLSRALRFDEQLKVNIPSTILAAGSSLWFASMGFGVWALVIQMVVASLSNLVLYYWRNVWRPTGSFRLDTLPALFRIGRFLLVEQLIGAPFRYIYIFFIARYFSASVAGLYHFADRVSELLIDQLVNVVQGATFPALARVQEDPERLKAGYRDVILATTFIVFPVLLLIVSLIETLFVVLLPERWLGAADYLQLMCIASIMYPLHALNLNMLRVTGRTDLVLYLGILKRCVAALILAVSFQYGIIAILIGQIVDSLIAYIPNSYYSKRLIGYSAREQVRDVLPNLGLAVGVAGVVYLLAAVLNLPPWIELVGLGVSGSLAYIGLAALFKLQALQVLLDLRSHRR